MAMAVDPTLVGGDTASVLGLVGDTDTTVTLLESAGTPTAVGVSTAHAQAPIVVAASVRQRRARIFLARNRPEWGFGVAGNRPIVVQARQRLVGRPNAAKVFRNGPAVVVVATPATKPIVVQAPRRLVRRPNAALLRSNRPEWGFGVATPHPDIIVIPGARRGRRVPGALIFRNGPAPAAIAQGAPKPLVILPRRPRGGLLAAILRRNGAALPVTPNAIVVKTRAQRRNTPKPIVLRNPAEWGVGVTTPQPLVQPRTRLRRRLVGHPIAQPIILRNPAVPAVVASSTPRPLVILRRNGTRTATIIVRRGAPAFVAFATTRQPIIVARPLRRRKGYALTVHGFFPPSAIAYPGRGGSECYVRPISGSDTYARTLGATSEGYARALAGSDAYIRPTGGTDTYIRPLGGSNA